MSHSASSPEGALTEERLFDERYHFWGEFYRFVWGMAAVLAVMLILMAYFLT